MSFGIVNIGATCYMNACITALGHCDKFLKFIINYPDDLNDKNVFINELKKIYISLWKDNKHCLNPSPFIMQLRKHIKNMDILDQNDIGEFLLMFIDKLNSSICQNIDRRKAIIHSSKYDLKNGYDVQKKIMDDVYFDSVRKEYSGLIPLFYGQNITQIVCGHCEKIHHTYEIFSSIMLPISKQMTSFEECMDAYFQKETLTTWKCDKCEKLSPSCKSLILWKTPDILIFIIKRFTDDMKKNNASIKMPLKMDLSKYSLDIKNNIYKLKSVSFHIGNFHNGHYFSKCLNQNDDSWYNIDDLDVRCIKNDDLDLSLGYIYFYQASKS